MLIPVAPFLLEAGFAATALGLQLRVARRLRSAVPAADADAEGAADEIDGSGSNARRE